MLKAEKKKNWTRIQKDFFIRISDIKQAQVCLSFSILMLKKERRTHMLVCLSVSLPICLSLSVAHAEGREKDKLDKDTEGFLHQNNKGIKEAQVSLSVCLPQSLMLRVKRKKHYRMIEKDFFIRILKISNRHRLVCLPTCLSCLDFFIRISKISNKHRLVCLPTCLPCLDFFIRISKISTSTG